MNLHDVALAVNIQEDMQMMRAAENGEVLALAVRSRRGQCIVWESTVRSSLNYEGLMLVACFKRS